MTILLGGQVEGVLRLRQLGVQLGDLLTLTLALRVFVANAFAMCAGGRVCAFARTVSELC